MDTVGSAFHLGGIMPVAAYFGLRLTGTHATYEVLEAPQIGRLRS